MIFPVYRVSFDRTMIDKDFAHLTEAAVEWIRLVLEAGPIAMPATNEPSGISVWLTETKCEPITLGAVFSLASAAFGAMIGPKTEPYAGLGFRQVPVTAPIERIRR